MSADNELEGQEFCNRWKKNVFTFCWAFLGDGAAAEEAACEAFAACCQRRELRMSDREIPSRLLGLAWRATEKYRNGRSQSSPSVARLEDAIQHLPRLERAVVIMRSLLHIEWALLARAVERSPVEAHKVWMRGIFQLNDLLQRRLL